MQGHKPVKVVIASLAIVLGLGGCEAKTYLMPTPNIYTHAEVRPFADVPPALQGADVPLLYVTDRVPEKETPDHWDYGYHRSRSAAFGGAVVQFGDDLSWEEIVDASCRSKRKPVELKVTTVQELARFDPTPPSLVITDAQMASGQGLSPQHGEPEAERRFKEELAARLAKTPHKEVLIYVHGFDDTFDFAVQTTAELWHFLGREGVPVCYTWPAGIGLLKAYEYTLASTQFTIYHFKQLIRLIASCPEVETVNIIAHSRGTAVTTDALRELYLELRGTTDAQKALKLDTVILAAADIDLDVAIERNATERVARAVQRSAVYVSRSDKALGLSSWLFGGERVGDVDPKIFSREEIDVLRHAQRFQVIDARVKKSGSFGHSYFHASPAVSSDLILLMRYHLPPGAEHGRPLAVSKTGLWLVTDDYPGAGWALPEGVRND